jgi:hypothetical protein
MLFGLEYPYLMMIPGGILVALGFFGVAFMQKGDGTPVSERRLSRQSQEPLKKVEWSPAALDPSKNQKKK